MEEEAAYPDEGRGEGRGRLYSKLCPRYDKDFLKRTEEKS